MEDGHGRAEYIHRTKDREEINASCRYSRNKKKDRGQKKRYPTHMAKQNSMWPQEQRNIPGLRKKLP